MSQWVNTSKWVPTSYRLNVLIACVCVCVCVCVRVYVCVCVYAWLNVLMMSSIRSCIHESMSHWWLMYTSQWVIDACIRHGLMSSRTRSRIHETFSCTWVNESRTHLLMILVLVYMISFWYTWVNLLSSIRSRMHEWMSAHDSLTYPFPQHDSLMLLWLLRKKESSIFAGSSMWSEYMRTSNSSVESTEDVTYIMSQFTWVKAHHG